MKKKLDQVEEKTKSDIFTKQKKLEKKKQHQNQHTQTTYQLTWSRPTCPLTVHIRN